MADDGFFAASSEHPEVRLKYSNADGSNPQTRSVEGEGEFILAVPAKVYRSVVFFMTSSEGASRLTVSFEYADGERTRRPQADCLQNPRSARRAQFAPVVRRILPVQTVIHSTRRTIV